MQNPHLLRRMTSTFSNPPCCPPHCKLRPAGAESPESYEVTWHQAVGIGLKFGISSKSKEHVFGCWACRISKERSQLLIIGFYFHDEDVIYVMFGTKQKWSLRVNMSKPYNTRDDSPATSVFTPGCLLRDEWWSRADDFYPGPYDGKHHPALALWHLSQLAWGLHLRKATQRVESFSLETADTQSTWSFVKMKSYEFWFKFWCWFFGVKTKSLRTSRHNSGFAGKFCCHLPCGKATPARQGLRLAAISPSVSAFDSRNTGRLSLVQHHIGLLVGGWPTPLKNMTSSVGMMTFPTEWENKIHVPNHQPDI